MAITCYTAPFVCLCSPVLSDGGIEDILHDLQVVLVGEGVEALLTPVPVVGLIPQCIVCKPHVVDVLHALGADPQRS